VADDAPGCRAVVTLVHGTWASAAPWTQPGSALRRTLEQELGDGVEVRTFGWTGANTQAGRLRGGHALRAALTAGIAERRGAKQFVIAHSHGGNIACYALQDRDVRDGIDGVICLATPFLHVHRGRLPRSLLFTAVAFLAACVALVCLSVFGTSRQHPALTALALAGLGLFAVVCVVMAVTLVRGGNDRISVRSIVAAVRDPEALVRALALPAMDRDRFVAVRITGDEAAGALGSSQFFVWLFRSLWSFLAPVWETFDRIRRRVTPYLGFALIAATVATSFTVITSDVAEVVRAGIVVALAGSGLVALAVGLVAFFVLTLMVLVHSPFGIDTILATLDLQTTAEPSPPGAALVFHVTPDLGARTTSRTLRHSRIYDDPQVLGFLSAWIKARLERRRDEAEVSGSGG
jgi:hypothetical protein